jgi:hypothetical protein
MPARTRPARAFAAVTLTATFMAIRPVGKRIGPGKILDVGFGEAGWRVVETYGAFEAKLRGPICETGGCDMISEDILRPGKLAWLRRDFERDFEYLLVLIVTRTQHDPVLTECDRLLIVVGRNVSDRENRHCGPTRMRPNMQFLRQWPYCVAPCCHYFHQRKR